MILAMSTDKKAGTYIWEKKGWPNLRFRIGDLAPLLALVREAKGELLGTIRMFGSAPRLQAAVEAMTQEVVSSSAIEGVNLSLDAVRESLMLRLGALKGGMPHAGTRRVDPVVGILTEAVQGWKEPLSLERIFRWHQALFHGGFSPHLGQIRVGEFRGEEPMAVVTQPRRLWEPLIIHYEAPPSPRLEREMAAFLGWFNAPPEGLDSLLRSGLAHFWFVTIHPFEDGNGRLARTLGNLALTQADQSALRFYSFSGQIMRDKASYYNALEQAQHGGLDVTAFLEWFLRELLQAIRHGIREAHLVLARTLFWEHASKVKMNERQQAALRKALALRTDGAPEEDGTLSNRHYRTVTGANRITATRDLVQLVELGLLIPHGAGRGASYRVPLERFLPRSAQDVGGMVDGIYALEEF